MHTISHLSSSFIFFSFLRSFIYNRKKKTFQAKFLWRNRICTVDWKRSRCRSEEFAISKIIVTRNKILSTRGLLQFILKRLCETWNRPCGLWQSWQFVYKILELKKEVFFGQSVWCLIFFSWDIPACQRLVDEISNCGQKISEKFGEVQRNPEKFVKIFFSGISSKSEYIFLKFSEFFLNFSNDFDVVETWTSQRKVIPKISEKTRNKAKTKQNNPEQLFASKVQKTAATQLQNVCRIFSDFSFFLFRGEVRVGNGAETTLFRAMKANFIINIQITREQTKKRRKNWNDTNNFTTYHIILRTDYSTLDIKFILVFAIFKFISLHNLSFFHLSFLVVFSFFSFPRFWKFLSFKWNHVNFDAFIILILQYNYNYTIPRKRLRESTKFTCQQFRIKVTLASKDGSIIVLINLYSTI